MTVGKVRVLVVEDSVTARKRLCEVLAAAETMEVVGEAADGRQAIELCESRQPDVITMDMMLPVMSGLAATEYIMANRPTPILVVSSSVNRGELFQTYEALAAGAVDVLEKPRGDEPDGDWERQFVATVRLVSRIRVITHPRARIGALGRTEPRPVARAPTASPMTRGPFSLVAIGASTGGPGAILEILRGLPREFPLPILLVLHIGEAFGAAFADWLDAQTPRRAEYARDGQPISAASGRVVLAPPGRHLTVRGRRLRLTLDPERNFCRPSVDVLFESVAREYGPSAVACLLTGMGRDGASGLLQIRGGGGLTLAQDEATSVVYGMPRAAVLAGAAELIVPLGEIGPLLASLAVTRAGVA